MDLDPLVSEPVESRSTQAAWGFPCPMSDEMRILGITLDPHLALGVLSRCLVSKALVRRSIFVRVARTSWGLDASVLRVTHDAFVSSLLRYGLVFTGSCSPGDLLNKIGAGIIDVASRRISGLPRITRIEALHAASGTFSIRNRYAQHCGNFLHLVPTSHASGIRERVPGELQVTFGDHSLDPAAGVLPVDQEASFFVESSGAPLSILRRLRWMANYYRVTTNTSIFCVNAPERRRAGGGKGLAYTMYHVGTQALFQVGWRPACSRPHATNAKRALPPEAIRANCYPGQHPGGRDRIVVKGGARLKEGRIKVARGVLRVEEVFASVAVLSANGVVLQRSGSVHGMGFRSAAPAYVHEAAVLHAIRRLRQWVRTIEQYLPRSVVIFAGGFLVSHQITEGMRSGRCLLRPSAASGAVADPQGSESWLSTDTFLHLLCLKEESGGVDKNNNNRDLDQELLLRYAEHFRTVALPQQGGG